MDLKGIMILSQTGSSSSPISLKRVWSGGRKISSN